MTIITSVDALLALKLTTHCVALILIPTRQWILRHQATGASSCITTISIWSFLGVYIYCGVLVIMQCIIEKRYEGLPEMERIVKVGTVGYFHRLFGNSLSYTFLLWLLKSAFLGYFANLRDVLTKRARVLYAVACVYTAMTFITTLMLQIFWCYPVSTNWSLDPTVQCVHFKTLVVSTVHAMLNLTTDLLILAVALAIIASLNLNRYSRYALWFIAGIGSVSVIMCIVRYWETYRAIRNPQFGPIEVVRALTFWGNIEVFAALIAFCAPSFRALFTKRKTRQQLQQSSLPSEKSRNRSVGTNDTWDSYSSGARSSKDADMF